MYVYAHTLEAAAPTVFMGLATDLMHRDNFNEIHEKKLYAKFNFDSYRSSTERPDSSAGTVTTLEAGRSRDWS
jgi:hypothetical protein